MGPKCSLFYLCLIIIVVSSIEMDLEKKMVQGYYTCQSEEDCKYLFKKPLSKCNENYCFSQHSEISCKKDYECPVNKFCEEDTCRQIYCKEDYECPSQDIENRRRNEIENSTVLCDSHNKICIRKPKVQCSGVTVLGTRRNGYYNLSSESVSGAPSRMVYKHINKDWYLYWNGPAYGWSIGPGFGGYWYTGWLDILEPWQGRWKGGITVLCRSPLVRCSGVTVLGKNTSQLNGYYKVSSEILNWAPDRLVYKHITKDNYIYWNAYGLGWSIGPTFGVYWYASGLDTLEPWQGPWNAPVTLLCRVSSLEMDLEQWKSELKNPSQSSDYSAQDDECVTDGGTHMEAKCIFPFIYDGTKYNGCTLTGHNQPWCATIVDGSRGYVKDKWGNCASSCKLHSEGINKIMKNW